MSQSNLDTDPGFASTFAPPNPRANPHRKETPDTPHVYSSSSSSLLPDPTPSTMSGAGVGKKLAKTDDQIARVNLSVEGVRREKGVRRIELTNRDGEILRLCFEQQFIMMEHLRHFFPNVTQRRVEIRIAELVQTGFIRRENYPELGPKTVFRLTTRGVHAALSAGAMHLKPCRRLNPKTLGHDALVTSARLKLQNYWDATFVPERAIKVKDLPEIPDGLFLFRSGNGIALEIENSDKGRTRFLKLVERWNDIPSIPFILYVAAYPELYRTLRQYLSATSKAQPLGLLLWQDLQAGTPSVWTPRGELDLLSRREF